MSETLKGEWINLTYKGQTLVCNVICDKYQATCSLCHRNLEWWQEVGVCDPFFGVEIDDVASRLPKHCMFCGAEMVQEDE